MSAIIEHLKILVEQRKDEVDAWFAAAFAQTPPSFYSSVDLRHSGFKIAPVDTNLFPAGFNHLSAKARMRASEQVKAFMGASEEPIERVLIIPENHTRNTGYIDNLAALSAIVRDVGCEVAFGSLIAASGEPVEVVTSEEHTLIEHPLTKEHNQLRTEDGFTPDMIIVNNDLTSGSPSILKGVTQLIVPQLGHGWYRRKKSIHFDAYSTISHQFAEYFGVEHWLLCALHHKCGLINFQERKGIECVALGVEKVMRRLREKYKEHGITQEPYTFIKADSGTYGMGIMTARSGDEVMEINKKNRKKMNVTKEGQQTTEVIIQEGLPTVDGVKGHSAEPMMYLVNGQAVGGAFRVNSERDAEGNLNAAGMYFSGMCDEEEREDSTQVQVKDCHFGVYGLLARLATLAAAREEYGEEYVI